MKSLERLVDKLKPNFSKGGKYERFGAVFESFETFLFVPGHTTPRKGAHVRDAIDSKRLMIFVVLALVPALLFGMWNTGNQYFSSIGVDAGFMQEFMHGLVKVVPLIFVAYAAGLGTEFIFVYIKNKEIEEGFLVSGLLIAMIVPVDVPLWMVAVATSMSALFGKEVFGGTGMNIVNPALLARAILFFAYPSKMSGDKIWISGMDGGHTNAAGEFVNTYGEKVVDVTSGATPLGQYASTVDLNSALQKAQAAGDTELAKQLTEQIASTLESVPSVWDSFIGTIPGSIGETSTAMILLGAAFLLFTGVANWRVMLSVFMGGAFMGFIFNLIGANPYMDMPFYEHLVVGGFAFGAVFMATDPVTAAQTERGKWIYGFLIGAIALIVRILNPAYPEGMMLSILLMNIFASTIDHFVVRKNVKRRMNRLKVKAQA